MSPLSAEVFTPRLTDCRAQRCVNKADVAEVVRIHLIGAPVTPFVSVVTDVFRYDAGRFGLGSDLYSFNQLSPGFWVDKFQFWHFDMSQEDCDDFYADGFWEAYWKDKDNAVQVYTQEQHCHMAPTVNTPSYDYSWSHYALAVWVVGPRGVNPLAVQQ
ncbi:MAG TPA: hypothetical protein VI685_28505 [Candidatus Angelobacter sp.]